MGSHEVSGVGLALSLARQPLKLPSRFDRSPHARSAGLGARCSMGLLRLSGSKAADGGRLPVRNKGRHCRAAVQPPEHNANTSQRLPSDCTRRCNNEILRAKINHLLTKSAKAR